MPATEAVSIANLANDEWTVRSVNRPEVVTVGLWLDDTLREHRAACVAAGITGPVSMQYQLDGEDVDGEVRRVRSVVEWLHETYREAKTLDVTSRPERYALLERLSQSRVMPSEMAVMLGVDVRVAERFAGDDDEARIARSIFHQAHQERRTPTMPTANEEQS